MTKDARMRPNVAENRRKLIKGAVGAPIIYTLTSGAPLAAASMTCQDKSRALAQAERPSGLVGQPDNWVRLRLQVYEAHPDPSGDKIQVVTLDQATWYKLDGTKQAVKIGNGNSPKQIDGRFAYGLVDYTNSASSLYKVYPAQQPVLSPIAGASCWNSLTGQNIAGNFLIP